MADQASLPADVADEATDSIATAEPRDRGTDAIDPIIAAAESGDGNLLGELARAMHAAATSQYQRLNADLERRRTEQVEAISERAATEIETLKADSETDIGSIELWAKAETEKIELERLRRIDDRREQLAAQLDRQETIKQREVFAIEVAIDAHRNEVDLFFGRMERESDPSAIARVAATMPPFPSLGDVAEQARRGTAAEFASLDGQAAASTEALAAATAAAARRAAWTADDATESSIATIVNETAGAAEADAPEAYAVAAEADAPEPETGSETVTGDEDESGRELEAAASVSESRLMAVMDPAASRGGSEAMESWDAPSVVSVAAGTGQAEEPVPMTVGSTLLRTVRSIRPMAARHDKDSNENDAG